ncbi:hypothetical protein [Acinetobacter terrae]|jgi:hypothetical protein|uniref:Uncharacterized protein n=1 Tax=Acinetobacter terrae TaxID=2731247 RepID=A0ABX1V1J0_9GAMM|nr:hypothetical protein [Acinetobacter terrae]NNH87494.1 hypothetical protein [Acinetobacter terrae]
MSTSKKSTMSNVRVIVSDKKTHSEQDIAMGHKYISVFSSFFLSTNNEQNKGHKKRSSSCSS